MTEAFDLSATAVLGDFAIINSVTPLKGGGFAAVLTTEATLFDIRAKPEKTLQGADFEAIAKLNLLGTAEEDVLTGLRLGDVLKGFDSEDDITGHDGDDVLEGNDGDDTIDAGRNADKIDGGKGKDKIACGLGPDEASGGAGHDSVKGGDDGDVLKGDGGNDTLDGGEGADEIDGGGGDDRILAGGGIDRLTGGDGRDVIVIRDLDRPVRVTVTDFEPGRDKIDLVGFKGAVSFSDLRIADDGSGHCDHKPPGRSVHSDARGRRAGGIDFLF